MPRCDSFTFDELTRITAGRWADPVPGTVPGITAVTDTTADLPRGALFVAIRGETKDGHSFLRQAAETGAGAVCVDDRELDAGTLAALRAAAVPRLQVTDTLRAFQELARAHRLRFPQLTVVAITGSCGKTSTKEMIAAVLEAKWPGAVLKTEGNTNNHFGVPRNLLRLTPEHEGAVLELGSNHPGEIAGLVRLVEPQVAVVSNIGRAHLKYFIDEAGVAREKGSIFSRLPPYGTAIYPAAAKHVEILRELAAGRRQVTFTGAAVAADIRVEYLGVCRTLPSAKQPVENGQNPCRNAESDRLLGPRDAGHEIKLSWPASGAAVVFTWNIGGEHQASNAGAAAAVGTVLGVPAERIGAALAACRLPDMRMEVREIAGVHWVNDAYNSNPDSAAASVAWFGELTADVPRDNCVLVLGDMREQNATEEQGLHLELLEQARRSFPGAAIVPVGELMTAAAMALGGFQAFADSAGARAHVHGLLKPGAWILLKGSHGLHLETLLPGTAAPQ